MPPSCGSCQHCYALGLCLRMLYRLMHATYFTKISCLQQYIGYIHSISCYCCEADVVATITWSVHSSSLDAQHFIFNVKYYFWMKLILMCFTHFLPIFAFILAFYLWVWVYCLFFTSNFSSFSIFQQFLSFVSLLLRKNIFVSSFGNFACTHAFVSGFEVKRAQIQYR